MFVAMKNWMTKTLPLHYLERILVTAIILPGITTSELKLLFKRSCDTFQYQPLEIKNASQNKKHPSGIHSFPMTISASGWYVSRLAMNSFYEYHHHHHECQPLLQFPWWCKPSVATRGPHSKGCCTLHQQRGWWHTATFPTHQSLPAAWKWRQIWGRQMTDVALPCLLWRCEMKWMSQANKRCGVSPPPPQGSVPFQDLECNGWQSSSVFKRIPWSSICIYCKEWWT